MCSPARGRARRSQAALPVPCNPTFYPFLSLLILPQKCMLCAGGESDAAKLPCLATVSPDSVLEQSGHASIAPLVPIAPMRLNRVMGSNQAPQFGSHPAVASLLTMQVRKIPLENHFQIRTRGHFLMAKQIFLQ